MIVLGTDMHKVSHTVAVIAATTGELVGEKTIQVGEAGFIAVLDWARSLGEDRVWALEDCRHRRRSTVRRRRPDVRGPRATARRAHRRAPGHRVMRQNVIASLVVKAIFVVLDPLGLVALVLAVAADMGMSLLVVTLNGLRLLRRRSTVHPAHAADRREAHAST